MAEILLKMCVGEIREGVIPPHLGFSNKFSNQKALIETSVPEGSTLIAEIELLRIKHQTGKFWNMDSDRNEKITYDEFKEYFHKQVKYQTTQCIFPKICCTIEPVI